MKWSFATRSTFTLIIWLFELSGLCRPGLQQIFTRLLFIFALEANDFCAQRSFFARGQLLMCVCDEKICKVP